MESKFLVGRFELAQETLPMKNPTSKMCSHASNHAIFSFMLEVLHRRSLDRSIITI
jgi:hypothetical protein